MIVFIGWYKKWPQLSGPKKYRFILLALEVRNPKLVAQAVSCRGSRMEFIVLIAFHIWELTAFLNFWPPSIYKAMSDQSITLNPLWTFYLKQLCYNSNRQPGVSAFKGSLFSQGRANVPKPVSGWSSYLVQNGRSPAWSPPGCNWEEHFPHERPHLSRSLSTRGFPGCFLPT